MIIDGYIGLDDTRHITAFSTSRITNIEMIPAQLNDEAVDVFHLGGYTYENGVYTLDSSRMGEILAEEAREALEAQDASALQDALAVLLGGVAT